VHDAVRVQIQHPLHDLMHEVPRWESKATGPP
jgi:hypothetical protein